MNTDSPSAKAVYRDPDRPLGERVADLLSRMTLADKVSQMCNSVPAIPRLGLHAYDFWSEGLHGVARNGRATVFPQPIGLAATWDPSLIEQVAAATGDEARAKYHAALRRKEHTGQYQGLTMWSPNVNIFRDPRWGRGQETWGEDPLLTGKMGAAFVRGLQGDHPVYLKAAACAKHFAVHSGPEGQRHTFNAQASARDLADTYLPAFETLVREANVEAVMGAYNRTNGEACCASPTLLQHVLREQWGFAGHVVSDCGALNDLHLHHQVTADAAESAALALKSGCDLSCVCTYEHLEEAVARGLVTEAEIDVALARTLATRFRLGMFDPPESVPYTALSLDVVNNEAHQALAYEAATKSVVLLKNRDDFLPLPADLESLLVVGPNAASLDVLLGNYFGVSETMTTFLEGVVGAAPEGVKLEYRPGAMLAQPRQNPLDWTLATAAASDVTLAFMGLSPVLEGEEGDALLSATHGDRSDLGLPPNQVAFIKELVAQGAKVVLVLCGGGPITLGELAELVEAVLFVWYPGQAGGKAVADLLFGKISPSGKLPLTFPQSVDQLPPFEDYAMANRTYRYSRETPLYPFGFGLSYAEFAYTALDLAQTEIEEGMALDGNFTLTNRGPVAAEEVAQIYLTDVAASVPVPRHKLVAFERVSLQPGESETVSFTITPEMMMLVDEAGELRLEPGDFRLAIGGCSPDEREVELGAPEGLTASFRVV